MKHYLFAFLVGFHMMSGAFADESKPPESLEIYWCSGVVAVKGSNGKIRRIVTQSPIQSGSRDFAADQMRELNRDVERFPGETVAWSKVYCNEDPIILKPIW